MEVTVIPRPLQGSIPRSHADPGGAIRMWEHAETKPHPHCCSLALSRSLARLLCRLLLGNCSEGDNPGEWDIARARSPFLTLYILHIQETTTRGRHCSADPAAVVPVFGLFVRLSPKTIFTVRVRFFVVGKKNLISSQLLPPRFLSKSFEKGRINQSFSSNQLRITMTLFVLFSSSITSKRKCATLPPVKHSAAFSRQ